MSARAELNPSPGSPGQGRPGRPPVDMRALFAREHLGAASGGTGQRLDPRRVYGLAAARLGQELDRLREAKLTSNSLGSGGLDRTEDDFWIGAQIKHPDQTGLSNYPFGKARLCRPRGLALALLWIELLALGEPRCVERMAASMLGAVARLEGELLAQHGIAPTPAMLALQEKMALEASSAGGPAPGSRQARL